MYRAKESGRARVALFDEEMRVRAMEQAELERALWRSLKDRELRVHYQPVVRLADHAVVGLEALLRWQHPQLGLLSPDAFIDVAEQSDLIVGLGTWVLNEVCRQTRIWRDTIPGFGRCIVWMNVSAAQFGRMDVAAVTAAALEAHQLDAKALGLEITESVFVDNTTAVRSSLHDLQELGVSIAIDDFGTGFSSLGALKRLPAQVLKIDGTFINGTDPKDSAIAAACIALAESLGLTAVAEAVETEEQRAKLIDMGYVLGQGFLFCRPVPPDHAEEFLRVHELARPRRSEAIVS
jgi:EAL domain-containing protein (putative c-di-GMP-specific phosphodiesterase class I)